MDRSHGTASKENLAADVRSPWFLYKGASPGLSRAAEKLGFVVGRGFIPGISVVILVAFGPEVRFFARGNVKSIPQGLKAE